MKLVRSGVSSLEIVARFRRERQVLARLEHPAIARLLDGGVAPDGRPWFAMERVDGEPITDYARARGLSLAARLRLLIEVGARRRRRAPQPRRAPRPQAVEHPGHRRRASRSCSTSASPSSSSRRTIRS